MRIGSVVRNLVVVVGALAVGGCGSKVGDKAGDGDSGTGTPTCAPNSGCAVADKSCLGLVDNVGKTTFGLRMSQVNVTSPTVLSTGIVATTVGGAAVPHLPACNLMGTATFSWLLQFDTTEGTILTGGAKPVSDPTAGYTFDTDMLSGLSLTPAVLQAKPDASGAFAATTGVDLNLPIFLDAAGTTAIVLPIHQARLNGTVSSSLNCIGSYNADGLDPGNSCQPDSTHPAFLDGGAFDGFISLADADKIVITPLQESLCVLLSGNAAIYGDGASPVQHCKTDSSAAIVYQGDWCAATNMTAQGTCADAVRIAGQFAASSVTIN